MKLLQKKQQLPNRRSNSLSSREGRASADDLNARYSFRRNRTLTGSLSSDVASANEHRSELRSPRLQTHHLRRHRRRLLLVFLGVSVAVAGLGWLIYQSIAGVDIVVKAPVPPVDTQLYEQKVQDYLNGRPLERNRKTVNTEALATYLQENGSPEVLMVQVSSSPAGFGASTLELTMRRPLVSWKTGVSRLYVDGTGAAFTRNYFAEPTVEVIDETGIQTVNNQVLASDRFLGFIGRMVGRLQEQSLTVTRVVLPANTTRQLLLSIQGVAYPVKVNIDRPAAGQAEDIARTIRHLAGKGIIPEYVDVRVEGRAYYK